MTRADLAVAESPQDPAVAATTAATLAGRTVAPEASLELTRRRMIVAHHRRLAVVDRGGRLLGLLCLKRTGEGFCSDSDVRSQEAVAARGTSLSRSSAPPQLGTRDLDRNPDVVVGHAPRGPMGATVLKTLLSLPLLFGAAVGVRWRPPQHLVATALAYATGALSLGVLALGEGGPLIALASAAGFVTGYTLSLS